MLRFACFILCLQLFAACQGQPNLTKDSAMSTNGFYCDPETGLCTIAPVEAEAAPMVFRDDVEIIYVGDPMCSWCWGISPALHQLEQRAQQDGIGFRLVMGGLRPGGGDPWNQEFKDFLRHHWEEVNARSGQPFGFELLERDNFNYDTEPSCRAVVAARQMNPAQEHHFYALVQHHFYVKNDDPAQVSFYRPICEELGLDFNQFSALFTSQEVKQATQQEFALNRSWGVRGYPTVLLRQGQTLMPLANGYATYPQMWQRVEQELAVGE